MATFRTTRLLPLLAILLLLSLVRAQLVIQTPSELGITEEKLESMLTAAQDHSFPQFDMVGAQDTEGTPGSPRLTECLTVERKLSLFYEYAREVGPVVCWVFRFVELELKIVFE
jgi:hypothetical protein